MIPLDGIPFKSRAMELLQHMRCVVVVVELVFGVVCVCVGWRDGGVGGGEGFID